MTNQNNQITNLLKDLQERSKELNCLYKIEELLKNPNISLDELFQAVVEIIPSGWQYPYVCEAKIQYKDQIFKSKNYVDSSFFQCASIVVQDKTVGQITVSYRETIPLTKDGYFLKEETKLIHTIADRLGHTILYNELKKVFENWEGMKKNLTKENPEKWQAILDTLNRSDKKLYIYISRKMLHYLCWNGIEEAKLLMEKSGTLKKISRKEKELNINRPTRKQTINHISKLSEEIFRIASENLNENTIVSRIQKWIKEDKSRFLVRAIENHNSTLEILINALTRYRYIESDEISLPPSLEKGLRVTLIRRFLSDSLDFINVANKYLEVKNYYDLVQKIIFPPESRGKLGGKSAGLFLATHILQKSLDTARNIKIPNTWYIPSDVLNTFLHYNNLDEVIEQKYKEIDEIRVEYPNIIQIFKNSYFPPEIINQLSIAIENLGEKPIIVRSSSLLEDRIGAVFSGKYKSLFLANQGSKEERLESLLDAIAEVYASTFAPDPIAYRAERGLLDYHEEMGILIQEVVGQRMGDYYLPMFAGIAFSNNEFRWSARINREDGLIRCVPGLGTRAVDRLSEDYPILISPGKPDLRVNVTADEVLRYALKKIDVINLKKNAFETIEISHLLKKFGTNISGIHQIVSVYRDDRVQRSTSSLNIDFEKDDLVVTFDGLIADTKIIKQLHSIMTVLQEKTGSPVDIEFAYDGEDLYILQCRPQSFLQDTLPPSIPKNIPQENIIFSANRYISNGTVSDISHIVYVDPAAYTNISSHDEMSEIGRIIGQINKILPKRRFILLGPGRWGSRGDIKLGVNVTYSDINNTAMLIEIARKKGKYVPELSFGTHFFQDLVEAAIRYLPLYPDEEGSVFNESFLKNTVNSLSDLLPEYSQLGHVVHVIDIPNATKGHLLNVLMNADINEAIGFLSTPESNK